jgi:hypothetical protein
MRLATHRAANATLIEHHAAIGPNRQVRWGTGVVDASVRRTTGGLRASVGR